MKGIEVELAETLAHPLYMVYTGKNHTIEALPKLTGFWKRLYI